jgi:hypothetical protein
VVVAVVPVGSYSCSGGGDGVGVAVAVGCGVAVLAGVDVATGDCVAVGVGVGVGLGVGDGLRRTWRVTCARGRWLDWAVLTRAVRRPNGSTFCVTQYVVPPPIARQPANAATAAPGRRPASGVGSMAR